MATIPDLDLASLIANNNVRFGTQDYAELACNFATDGVLSFRQGHVDMPCLGSTLSTVDNVIGIDPANNNRLVLVDGGGGASGDFVSKTDTNPQSIISQLTLNGDAILNSTITVPNVALTTSHVSTLGLDATNNIIKYDGRSEYLSKIDTLPQAVVGEVDFLTGIRSHYLEINSTTGALARITYDGADVKLNKEFEVAGNITSTGAGIISGQNVVASLGLSSNGTLFVSSTAQINGETNIGSHMYATGRCGGLLGNNGGTSTASGSGGSHPYVECGTQGLLGTTNGSYTGITFRKECMTGTCVLQQRTMDSGLVRKALLIVSNATHFTSLAEVHIITGDTTFSGAVIHTISTTPPLTATSAGVKGQVIYTADNVYVCIATNTWKRTALTTF